jgi:hypothetical protein
MSHHVNEYSTSHMQQTISYKQQFNNLIIKLNVSVNSTTFKCNVPLKTFFIANLITTTLASTLLNYFQLNGLQYVSIWGCMIWKPLLTLQYGRPTIFNTKSTHKCIFTHSSRLNIKDM